MSWMLLEIVLVTKKLGAEEERFRCPEDELFPERDGGAFVRYDKHKIGSVGGFR